VREFISHTSEIWIGEKRDGRSGKTRPPREISAFTRWITQARKRAILFLVDAAIKSADEASCRNTKSVANSQKSPESDRSARFDLLPVASRKTQRNHVLLGVSPPLPETLYPGPESAEEFAFVNHY